MPTRRFVIASIAVTALPGAAPAAPDDSFRSFVAGVKAEAMRDGVRPSILEAAFAGVAPNQRVLDRDRHQPEFTMTWARYRDFVMTDRRFADGRQAVAENRALLLRVQQYYGASAGVVSGIWGLESGYGQGMGSYRVVEALATLAWDGRRAGFFRRELIAALKILNHGDILAGAMLGSYAGAMGQPQFMPTSYLRYAVDFEGNGRRDIWTSKPDVLASIANYLAKAGWRDRQGWGQQVSAPAGMIAPGREAKQPLSAWARQGIRPFSDRWAGTADTLAGLIAPDGQGGDTFLVFANFDAIRRYNPSDYYALAVGLIGDRITM